MDEAKKNAGIHAHRTGRIEKNHQPEWLFLADSRDKTNRDTAMSDIRVNGTPKIEPMSASASHIPAAQPGAHYAGESRGNLVSLSQIVWIIELTKVDLIQALDP